MAIGKTLLKNLSPSQKPLVGGKGFTAAVGPEEKASSRADRPNVRSGRLLGEARKASSKRDIVDYQE